MKAVIQRVANAQITINGSTIRNIGKGLVVLLGVAAADSLQDAELLARKCAELRIFEDCNGKLNISASELKLDILAVSNFTLCADSKKGRRPSFINAARQPLSEQAYNYFIECLKGYSFGKVETGQFGAEMQICLLNDGPITIILDTDEWKK